MVLADLRQEGRDTAKATDGPENRSVKVGQPGMQRLTQAPDLMQLLQARTSGWVPGRRRTAAPRPRTRM